MVGPLQHLPVIPGDARGARRVMVPGELHHERLGPGLGQVAGSDRAVVPVGGESAPEREPQGGGNGHQGAPQGAEGAVPLSHIVQESGAYQVGPFGPAGEDGARAVEPVPLIGGRLRPEERALCRPEPARYLGLLSGLQWPGGEHGEEAPRQVARPGRHTITRSSQPTARPTKPRARGKPRMSTKSTRKP